MKKTSISQEKIPSRANLAGQSLTRRRFFRSAAGTGAGLALGSTIARAREYEDSRPECPAGPRPIPHITGPGHFFFPGPVEGAPATNPNFPNAGYDPSIITDFKGAIAQAELTFSGTGTNLDTGESAPYDFHCDMRFMSGVFVGLDNRHHRGTLGFI